MYKLSRQTMIGAAGTLCFAVLFLFGAGCAEDKEEGITVTIPEGYTVLEGSGGATNQAVLGLQVPVTGASAETGDLIRDGARLALEEIDYQIADYDLKVVIIDSESDAAREGMARRNYEKTLNDIHDLSGMFLNWHSGVSLDCMEVAAEHQISHVFGYGATDEVTEVYESDSSYNIWLKGWPGPLTYVRGYTDVIQAVIEGSNKVSTNDTWEPATKVVMFVREEGSWGVNFVAGARNIIENDPFWADWTIYDEVVLTDSSDFNAIASGAADAGVTVVIGSSTADEIVGEAVRALSFELDTAVIAIDGLGWGDGLNVAGMAAIRVLDGGWTPFPETEQAITFQSQFQNRFGMAPTAVAGLSYDWTRFYIKVLEVTHETHSDLSRESITDIVVNQLQNGDITFNEGVLMHEYAFNNESVPDPIYDEDHFYFPIQQYQEIGGVARSIIIWPQSMANGIFMVPEIPAGP